MLSAAEVELFFDQSLRLPCIIPIKNKCASIEFDDSTPGPAHLFFLVMSTFLLSQKSQEKKQWTFF
jgi:hypothetical protein